MTETEMPQTKMDGQSALSAWGMPLQAVVCENCDCAFLIAPDSLSRRCPLCYRGEISHLSDESADFPNLYQPERLAPNRLTTAQLQKGLEEFVRGIPFAPQDLNASSLLGRLQVVFLPAWLVDVKAQAMWQAEMGFDYQVVSHQDRFDQNRGGWKSQEVAEKRTRWEARLGKLERGYENTLAPALENRSQVKFLVGDFDLQQTQAFSAQKIQTEVGQNGKQVFLRLPDRSPTDAWSEAQPALQGLAADECRRATGADHVRQFSWSPQFSDQNWSLTYQPAATTYYLDDERNPCVLFIHGQTGRINGARRASMQRAYKTTLALLAVAFVIFLASLAAFLAGALAPFLMPVGGVGLAAALALALGALIPIVIVWGFNQSQKPG